MNTPVSFKIAKLLKEKGFDKYGYLQDVWLGNKYEWKGKGKNKKSVEISVFGLGSSSVLPTIAEVVMWLYEKYGIWIEVTVEQYFNGNNWLWQAVNLRDAEKSTFVYGDNGEYKTPTEAYEAAILYTLNNLI